jgi:hypothetical protein
LKKFLKFCAYGFAILIGLSVIADMGKDEEAEPAQEVVAPVEQPKEVVEKPKQEPKQEVKEEPKEAPKPKKPEITKEAFDQIKQGNIIDGAGGSSREEVIKLLGEPKTSTESVSVGLNGQEIKTEYLGWFGKGFSLLSITITNGKVSHKMWSE